MDGAGDGENPLFPVLARLNRLALDLFGAGTAFVALGASGPKNVLCHCGEAPGPADLAFYGQAILASNNLIMPAAEESSARVFAGAPIKDAQGTVVGALCLRLDKPGSAWSTDADMHLRTLAELAELRIHSEPFAKSPAERRSNAGRQRLESCLEALPQGIAVFDGDDRLSFCNQSFLDLYPACSDRFKTGMLFEDILRIGLQADQFVDARDAAEDWLAQRLANHRLPAYSYEQRTGEGRTIRIDERRIATGESIGIRNDITDLKDREATFRLLFQANPVPMYIMDCETLRFLDVNSAALDLYGYGREAFLALSALDIRPESEGKALIETIGLKSHQTVPMREWTYLKADGLEFPANIYWQHTIYDGRPVDVVAVIDITEQKRALEEVRRTRTLLDNIVESMPIGVSVKDLLDDGRYVLANRALADLYGCKSEDMLKRTDHQLFGPAMADATAARDIKVLESSAALRVEEEVVFCPDAGKRLITTQKIPIFEPVSGFPRYVLTMSEDVTARRRIEQKIVHMAHHDALTGLPNRTLFRERLEAAVAQSKQPGRGAALLLIDLDHFKQINDTFGHPAGDALLRAVAKDLKACLRASDLPARLGGDEFAVLQTSIRTSAEAKGLAAKILKALTQVFQIEGVDLKIGVSIGIAIAPHDGVEADVLFKRADLALYRSKREGRGVSRFYDANLDHFVRLRRGGELDVQGGLARGEFELHYQPALDFRTGRISGYEALLRWRHPVRGLLGPCDVIDAAVNAGLLAPLGDWILRQACAQAAAWPDALTLTVNADIAQIESASFPAAVLASLAHSGLPAGRLRIDVREASSLHDDETARRTLTALRGVGVELAMDAFGEGASSFALLSSLPFTAVKLATELVQGTSATRRPAAMIRAVTGFAAELGMTTTAVGVETREQLEAMRAAGCAAAQGFFIGRPMPFDAAACVAESWMALAS